MAHTGMYHSPSAPAADLVPAVTEPESVSRWREALSGVAGVASRVRSAVQRWSGLARTGDTSRVSKGTDTRGASRKLQSKMLSGVQPGELSTEQGWVDQPEGWEGFLVGGVGVPAVEGVNAAENSFAREAFLHRFDGTAIDTVFAPGEYGVPE
jgi:hypothetical protein